MSGRSNLPKVSSVVNLEFVYLRASTRFQKIIETLLDDFKINLLLN